MILQKNVVSRSQIACKICKEIHLFCRSLKKFIARKHEISWKAYVKDCITCLIFSIPVAAMKSGSWKGGFSIPRLPWKPKKIPSMRYKYFHVDIHYVVG